MRWATVADGRAALVDGDELRIFEAPLISLLHDLDAASRMPVSDVVPLEGTVLQAPIPQPPSVRDFYAFEQHVKTARERRGLEMEPDWYELPIFYFSNPASIVGPDAVVPPASTQELDFELEVAAIVAGDGRSIAGFTVMNDWSARDIQRREMKLNLGPAKGKDFATSLGPFLVTPDELPESLDLRMAATVNGRQYSQSSLGTIHWSFDEMLAYAARDTPGLSAGDVIGSGTCGTGCILELSLVHGSDEYPWLRPGDEVVLEVEGLGSLRNVVGTPQI
jgi:2-keto-4-pentenoate hydratase/2-oxohepta-3-ene-1,7-dioic acid hydratase in catechol pathway